MGEGEAKAVVPESVVKKEKRNEEWALAKKQQVEAAKKKSSETRKLIFSRAKQYAKEYEEQVFKRNWNHCINKLLFNIYIF